MTVEIARVQIVLVIVFLTIILIVVIITKFIKSLVRAEESIKEIFLALNFVLRILFLFIEKRKVLSAVLLPLADLVAFVPLPSVYIINIIIQEVPILIIFT